LRALQKRLLAIFLMIVCVIPCIKRHDLSPLNEIVEGVEVRADTNRDPKNSRPTDEGGSAFGVAVGLTAGLAAALPVLRFVALAFSLA
jgi:hypothetical protein